MDFNPNTPAYIVKATNIKIVVAEPEWQKVRLGLKGRWNSEGKQCVAELRAYWNKDRNDPWRVRRMLNYVTCSGFRTSAIKEPSIEKLREEVRAKWYHLLGENATHRTGGKL